MWTEFSMPNGRQPSAASTASGVAMTLLHSTTNTECQTGSAELAGFPPKPPRSKLDPHRELIRELRRNERTYREVAGFFHERLGLHIALSTLHSFVKVRAKHRKRTQFELPPAGVAVTESPVLERVAALKPKPTMRKAKRARFVFHENEPLFVMAEQALHPAIDLRAAAAGEPHTL
jgi:hypothetical protein